MSKSDKEKLGESWLDLIKKRDRLAGTEIINKIRSLGTTQYGLNRNYEELQGLINFYEKSLKIWAVENRPQLDALQREILRLLHNYLASIYSFIEHTRKFLKDINNKKFNQYYEGILKTLKTNGSVMFLGELRVYAQHYELPFTTASISFKAAEGNKKGGTSEQKLSINTSSLLKWKGWGKASREFLKKEGKEIDIKKVTKEYQKLITEFYDKFYKEISQIYKKEILELAKVEKKIFELQEKIKGGRQK